MSTCPAFALLRLGQGYGLLLLSAALVATGCATTPGPHGPGGTYHQRAAVEGAESAEGAQPWLELPEDSPPEPRVRRLRYRHPERMWGTDPSWVLDTKRARQEEERGEPPAPSCPRVPLGWPEEADDEELLAPLLACSSTADFLALQRGVDMARVVERLGEWSAVRLGALGPLVDARASQVLTRKRASFLLTATADHGAYAEVFALFIAHAA